MSMQIRINITGDQEVIRYFQSIMRHIDSGVVQPFITDYANTLRDNMVRRMHSVSGDMIRSTLVKSIAQGKMVEVGVRYAQEENTRPGRKRGKRGTGQGTPHRYAEPALQATDNTKDAEFLRRIETFLRTV